MGEPFGTLPPSLEASAPVAAGPVPRPITPPRPSRLVVTTLGILGCLALAAATGYKIVTKPGRIIPPPNPRLRAAKVVHPDGDREGGEGTPAASNGGKGHPAPNAPGKGTTAGGSPSKPQAKEPSRVTPTAPTERKPELGPPPTEAEIRACIDAKKSRIRNCANRAAENFEYVGGGMARATLNPDGKFTNIYVPGGPTFSSCTKSVIRSLTCRPYRGGPIQVSYPIK